MYVSKWAVLYLAPGSRKTPQLTGGSGCSFCSSAN